MAKRTTTKKPATKKTPTKRTVAKKPIAKKTAKKTLPKLQSFKVAPETQPFTTFKVTEQTVYWLIFTGAVLFLGLWIMKINIQVQQLYDEIDQNRITQMEIDNRFRQIQAEKRNEQ